MVAALVMLTILSGQQSINELFFKSFKFKENTNSFYYE